ncbi:MAG: NADPH-dependent F420 reductase [Candidatus Thiodiazotropha sp.]
MSDSLPIVAVLGGTGDLGGGLAYQLAKAGYPVIIGSRGEEKAKASAKAMSDRVGTSVDGRENSTAARIADLVIMTVPFASHDSTLKSVRDAVQGKVFVDATVPLVPPKVARVQLPADGPAAKQSQMLLGENVRVVSAFQNIAAAHLQSDDGHHNECDVLVSGNDPEARDMVVKLARDIGLRAWHAGAIDNSAVAEALTSVLIFLNKRYKINGAGLRITGEPGSAV